MKNLLFVFGLSVLSMQVFAIEDCSNKAKYYATKVYHAQMGAVQGSDGIEREARLVSERGDILNYVVTLSDNNDEGEAWEVDYRVSIDNSAGECTKRYVRKIAARDL